MASMAMAMNMGKEEDLRGLPLCVGALRFFFSPSACGAVGGVWGWWWWRCCVACVYMACVPV